jgi:hypothetical protein
LLFYYHCQSHPIFLLLTVAVVTSSPFYNTCSTGDVRVICIVWYVITIWSKALRLFILFITTQDSSEFVSGCYFQVFRLRQVGVFYFFIKLAFVPCFHLDHGLPSSVNPRNWIELVRSLFRCWPC